MPKLKRSEMRKLDSILDMEGGYCLDFSDRTISEFFEDELGIEIYQEKYAINGGSKAKHVRAFIEVETGTNVAQMLRKMWAHRETLSQYQNDSVDQDKAWLFDLISRMSTGDTTVATAQLAKKAKVLNLDTVSRDLDRALDSAKSDPESALTSACSTLESVCRSLLIEMDCELPKVKDLKSLYKAVRKPLGLNPDKSEFPNEIANDVLTVLSGLTTVVEGISSLRTHAGDAHGRERGYARIDTRIASLAVHSSSTLALFLIETWQRKFPSKELYEH